MKSVFIVAATRTPVGSFGGVFKGFNATELGGFAIKGALEKAGIDPSIIDEVFMGNVVSANLGQAPAKQASIYAGLSNTIPTTHINKVCASGTKSIMIAAQSIMAGYNDIVIAGGMESMSNIPYYVPNARYGYTFGNASFVDGLMRDGLEDAYSHNAMGIFADATAAKFEITREMQDEFAIRSYKLAIENTENGNFKDEITAVSVPQRKKDPIIVDKDEEPQKARFDKVSTLRPAFTKDGTVTAANASKINDGASAFILVSEEKLKELNLTPLARIVSFADASHEPEWFTTAPTKAAPIALQRAGLTLNDIDLFEVNEAFAVVTLAFNKVMGIDPEKVNVFGGSVAIGHPLGASGARITTTLVNALHKKGGKYGLVAICNGGGGASSLIIERV